MEGQVGSMRASSPPHHKASHLLADDQSSWMLQHPSGLDMFEQITKASKGNQIVIFLDYDGTLSPIVDDPDCAFMSDAMRATVRKLARYIPTAIVSGRCRDKVYSFVCLAELYYAGSHGMDIKGPSKGSNYIKFRVLNLFCQPASEYLPMIDEATSKTFRLKRWQITRKGGKFLHMGMNGKLYLSLLQHMLHVLVL